jgi:hypothetical protein
MKKKLFFALGLAGIIALSVSIGVYAAADIKLLINGKVIAADIQIIKGSSYVPLKVVSESLGAEVKWDGVKRTISITSGSPVNTPAPVGYTLEFPIDRYPLTAKHILLAIAKGESDTCTIDREGADKNRDESLKGILTKDGYDRDEWPMAMCAEGGSGADVEYVLSSDNRGSGSWVGNQLEKYPNGTKVLFIFKTSNTTIASTPTPAPTSSNVIDFIKYKNCTEVKAAGKAPLHTGDPGYSTSLDRDGDGIACE